MFDVLEGIAWLIAKYLEMMLIMVLLVQTVREFQARRSGRWRDRWVSPREVWAELKVEQSSRK